MSAIEDAATCYIAEMQNPKPDFEKLTKAYDVLKVAVEAKTTDFNPVDILLRLQAFVRSFEISKVTGTDVVLKVHVSSEKEIEALATEIDVVLGLV